MKQGYGYNDTHNIALEIHNVQPQALYSPEIVQEYTKWFNKNDFEYWEYLQRNKNIGRKIMKEENFIVTKLRESSYGNVIQNADNEIIYCEIQYQRDRSSFAGMALKVTSKKNCIVVRGCQEKIVQDVSKYEKLYIGCENDYADSIKDIFSLKERTYGIDVFFLVYSDVRSSQIIFEELMINVDNNIDKMRRMF